MASSLVIYILQSSNIKLKFVTQVSNLTQKISSLFLEDKAKMRSKVNPEKVEGENDLHERVIVDEGLCKQGLSSLTVWKRSLLLKCHGFTVFDHSGSLLFRVDNYELSPRNEILLMDASGKPLLTIRKKPLSLQGEWQIYRGEYEKQQKPMLVVKKPSPLLMYSNQNRREKQKRLAEVYVCSSERKHGKSCDYRIEGSYSKRAFKIYGSNNEFFAEAMRKQVNSHITLGADVFSLKVNPGYDQAFVMGLLIAVDRIVSARLK